MENTQPQSQEFDELCRQPSAPDLIRLSRRLQTTVNGIINGRQRRRDEHSKSGADGYRHKISVEI